MTPEQRKKTADAVCKKGKKRGGRGKGRGKGKGKGKGPQEPKDE